MRNARGFTLHQLLVALFVLAVVGICFLGVCHNVSGAAGGTATETARRFARNTPGATEVECMSYDTDNDGYVSCTIFRADAEPLFLECFSWGSAGTCRMPKLRVNR